MPCYIRELFLMNHKHNNKIHKTRKTVSLVPIISGGQTKTSTTQYQIEGLPPHVTSVSKSCFTSEKKRPNESLRMRHENHLRRLRQRAQQELQRESYEQGQAQHESPSNALQHYKQPHQLIQPPFHANSPPFLLLVVDDNTTSTTSTSISSTRTSNHQDLSPAKNYPTNDMFIQAYYMNQLQLQKAWNAERRLHFYYNKSCGIRLHQNLHQRSHNDPQAAFLPFSPYHSAVPARAVPGSRHLLPPQQPPTTTICVRNGAAGADMTRTTAAQNFQIQFRPTAAKNYKRPRHYLCRPIMSLHVEDSDDFLLTPFLCFLRKDCLELFEAEQCDVFERKRSKPVVLYQVGVRCRFCAHVEHNDRMKAIFRVPIES